LGGNDNFVNMRADRTTVEERWILFQTFSPDGPVHLGSQRTRGRNHRSCCAASAHLTSGNKEKLKIISLFYCFSNKCKINEIKDFSEANREMFELCVAAFSLKSNLIVLFLLVLFHKRNKTPRNVVSLCLLSDKVLSSES